MVFLSACTVTVVVVGFVVSRRKAFFVQLGHCRKRMSPFTALASAPPKHIRFALPEAFCIDEWHTPSSDFSTIVQAS